MFNLKRILSLSLFASLLGSASTFAGGGPGGPDEDEGTTTTITAQPRRSSTEISVDEEVNKAQSRTNTNTQEEEAALKEAKAGLKRLARDKHLILPPDELKKLRNVYIDLSREERIAIVTGRARDDGKIVNVGSIRIGPSDDRLLGRLEKRLGIQ